MFICQKLINYDERSIKKMVAEVEQLMITAILRGSDITPSRVHNRIDIYMRPDEKATFDALFSCLHNRTLFEDEMKLIIDNVSKQIDLPSSSKLAYWRDEPENYLLSIFKRADNNS